MSKEREGPMKDEDIESTFGQMIDEARAYITSDLVPLREKATRYYKGEPFGDEEEGRSKVVMTVVRDTVQSILPSLLRVFTSQDRYVEYRPRRQEDVPTAEQRTEYRRAQMG